MGQETNIEWCDSTVNPTTGCDGCELWNKQTNARHCYAGNLHEDRLSKSLPELYSPRFEEVRTVLGRMRKSASWPDLRGKARPDKPWLDGMPRMIFVGDMADIFSKAVPFEFLRDELIGAATSPEGSRHVYMLLTKQAGRAADFGTWLVEDQGIPWPENVWQGVSVTTQRTASRLRIIARHPARTKFVSAEPLLGPVRLVSECPIPATGDHPEMVGYMVGPDDQRTTLDRTPAEAMAKAGFRLVIIGGESGMGARPLDYDWASSLVRECKSARVAAFVKQVGPEPYTVLRDANNPGYRGTMSTALRDKKGGDPSEWPMDLRVREFPAILQGVA